MQIFSEPQTTIKAAQELHKNDIFKPAAVFRTQDNKFVMAELRVQEWSMPWLAKAAAAIKKATGNQLVAFSDPLMGIWKDDLSDIDDYSI